MEDLGCREDDWRGEEVFWSREDDRRGEEVFFGCGENYRRGG